MDDSELSSVIRDQDNGVDTSDTSDDEMWYESSRVSPVSSDSSFNESDNEGGKILFWECYSKFDLLDINPDLCKNKLF